MTKPVLETERLTLRCCDMGDIDDVWRVLSEKNVYDMTIAIPKNPSRMFAADWIEKRLKQWDEGSGYMSGLFLKEGKKYAGYCGLVQVSTEHKKAELVYSIGEEHYGKGLAVEAARAVCAFGFETLELNRISGGCFTVNARSKRVLEKIGFKYEGMIRQDYCKDGVYMNHYRFGLLAKEFI